MHKVPGSVTEVERERLKLNEQKSELQIEQAQLEQSLSKLAALSKQVEVQTAEINDQTPADHVAHSTGSWWTCFPHQGEWMQLGRAAGPPRPHRQAPGRGLRRRRRTTPRRSATGR
jgi:hypothetical protein